jgi:cephalosporin hydroxylase
MNIPTQLSTGDCNVLQAVQNHISQQQPYTYLEIGSYLGGSLHAHLTTPRCELAWSVDTRRTGQIRDERRIDYAYTATTQDMLDLLAANNIPTDRLHTIDGTVADVPDIRVDLIFIDGEHTNPGVISDAVNCLRFNPRIIMFHDDWIVSDGIDHVIQYLVDQSVPADVYKMRDSDITVIAFGSARSRFAEFARGRYQNWTEFRTQAQARLNKERK